MDIRTIDRVQCSFTIKIPIPITILTRNERIMGLDQYKMANALEDERARPSFTFQFNSESWNNVEIIIFPRNSIWRYNYTLWVQMLIGFLRGIEVWNFQLNSL